MKKEVFFSRTKKMCSQKRVSLVEIDAKRSQIAVWHHPKLNTKTPKPNRRWLNACTNARAECSHRSSNWVVIIAWMHFSVDRFNERIQQISNKSLFEIKLWIVDFFFVSVSMFFFFALFVVCTWFLCDRSPNWMVFFLHSMRSIGRVDWMEWRLRKQSHGLDVVCLYPNSDWIKH